nr:MAG: Protein of unknown function (DUF551) [Bacteriophage sp.]
MEFISWLTLLLIALKLSGVISWSWFYIFLLAIADLVISILILVVAKMIWDKQGLLCESEGKMAITKRTSDITVALYEWNKLTTRNIAEDEKEYFNGGIEFVWEGKTPEIDEEVLVYNPKTQNIYTDIWIDYGEGIGFENTDEDTVFWMSYPKPPKEEVEQ